MARQFLVPGYGYANETATRQFLVPGYGYANETVAASGAAKIIPEAIYPTPMTNLGSGLGAQ